MAARLSCGISSWISAVVYTRTGGAFPFRLGECFAGANERRFCHKIDPLGREIGFGGSNEADSSARCRSGAFATIEASSRSVIDGSMPHRDGSSWLADTKSARLHAASTSSSEE